jgi:hypothetical protein
MANVSAAHFIGNAKGTKGDTIMAFKKATKQATSIKIAISGTAGSGKTYSALRIAKGLGGKTALLDTEGGSASLYADRFEFDTWDEADPTGFPPEYFIRVIKAAEEAGYSNLIFDSLSHEWSGRGGCLELADAIARSKYRGNTFTAWNDVTPRHNKLVETMLNSRLNIIATMRSKSDYVLTKDEKTGKTTPQKVGLASIQRDGIDYEFTIMFELDRDSHLASAGKDRTSMFQDPEIISEETGKRISNWLSSPQTLQEVVKSQKKDPLEYIKTDLNNRVDAGEDPEKVMMDYSEILKTDVTSIESLSEKEIVVLARTLFINNKNNGGNNA